MCQMLFIVVDARSKMHGLNSAILMSSTTSEKTIGVLRDVFARYDLLEQIISDDGPQFTSEEFETFTKSNGIRHIRSPPYHPSLVGKAFCTNSEKLKSIKNDSMSLQHKLATILLGSRSTPNITTGVSPAELFLKRRMRTRLDLLHQNLESTVAVRHEEQRRKKGH